MDRLPVPHPSEQYTVLYDGQGKLDWSKWGSWGIVEWFDEDAAKAPQFMATMRWAQHRGQTVNADRAP